MIVLGHTTVAVEQVYKLYTVLLIVILLRVLYSVVFSYMGHFLFVAPAMVHGDVCVLFRLLTRAHRASTARTRR